MKIYILFFFLREGRVVFLKRVVFLIILKQGFKESIKIYENLFKKRRGGREGEV